MAAADASQATPGQGEDRPRSESKHWEQLSTAAARDLPPGRLGGVIAQLRQRGRVANRRAGVFLFSLLLTVAAGLAYYIGLPLVKAYAEGTTRTWRDQVQAAEADDAELDTRLVAAIAPLKDALVLTPEVVRKPTGEGLSTPFALADGTLIAMGSSGSILRSADRGATWTDVRRQSSESFSTPLALTDGTLITTGESGTILRSADGGATWQVVRAQSETGEPLNTPLALADGTLIVKGILGKILRSTDGGRTWAQVRAGSDTEGFYTQFALADGALIATGSGILRSTDEGATWSEVRARSQTGEGFATPLALADSTLIATGSLGTMLRSTDGGATWPEMRGWSQDLEGFATPLALADGTLIAVGWQGTILRSADGGATWAEVRARSENGSELSTPLALADGTLIATGWGVMLRSADSGATWPEVRAWSGAGERPYTPLALADGTLIATGNFGTIRRSADGGATWAEVRAQSENGEGFDTPLALADGTLIAAGKSGTILRLSGDTAARLGALAADLPPGGTGDAQLIAFRDGLDPAVRAATPVAAALQVVDQITTERRPVEASLARARINLAKWTSGEAPAEVRRAAFAAFMEGCRTGAAEPKDAALTTACVDAFAASEGDTQRQWWESLAEKVPPGILLLFLLATLSGLYRYNVRLAGFHNGRADALELMVAGVDKDLLTAIADALAADKVEFGAAKTPTDHAAEMATALISRSKP